MARSDLLLALVEAAQALDRGRIRGVVEALAAEERAKDHHVLADRLVKALRESNGASPLAQPPNAVNPLPLQEIVPRRELDELILGQVVREACAELIEEQQRADLLRSNSLEPRHRLLLSGPPGNGKTSLAESVATALYVPMHVVRYDVLISSFLGETATRLRQVFDYVRERHCVLFFDEFDTIGKERGDIHETGEIKRVVSSLLLEIDDLPSYVVVIVATNHPELLDRAAWRRFQLRLSLPPPTREQVSAWFETFQTRVGMSLGVSGSTIASRLKAQSFSELEDFSLDVLRRIILEHETDPRQVVNERLRQWKERLGTPSAMPNG